MNINEFISQSDQFKLKPKAHNINELAIMDIDPNIEYEWIPFKISDTNLLNLVNESVQYNSDYLVTWLQTSGTGTIAQDGVIAHFNEFVRRKDMANSIHVYMDFFTTYLPIIILYMSTPMSIDQQLDLLSKISSPEKEIFLYLPKSNEVITEELEEEYSEPIIQHEEEEFSDYDEDEVDEDDEYEEEEPEYEVSNEQKEEVVEENNDYYNEEEGFYEDGPKITPEIDLELISSKAIESFNSEFSRLISDNIIKFENQITLSFETILQERLNKITDDMIKSLDEKIDNLVSKNVKNFEDTIRIVTESVFYERTEKISKEIDEFKEIITSFKEDISNINVQHTTEIENTNSEVDIDQLIKENNELRAQMESHNPAIQEYKDKIEQLEVELQLYATKIETKEQDILNLTTENDTRIENEKSYIQTIEQHTQTIEQLKNEINELRNRPSVEEISGEKDRRIKELERDIELYKDVMQKVNHEKNQLVTQNTLLKDELNRRSTDGIVSAAREATKVEQSVNETFLNNIFKDVVQTNPTKPVPGVTEAIQNHNNNEIDMLNKIPGLDRLNEQILGGKNI